MSIKQSIIRHNVHNRRALEISFFFQITFDFFLRIIIIGSSFIESFGRCESAYT